jgi:beta-phosphoglucomutase family hydrolase
LAYPAPVDWRRYSAVLFDLDGVLTPTARVHAAAWKETFDDFLTRRAKVRSEQFEPFDIDNDYRRYVDGRPRFDGVDAFLRSRGIELDSGEPTDPPGDHTVCAIGNRKQATVKTLLSTEGVNPYPGSKRLVEQLERQGLRMAVVSASANAADVLRAASLVGHFEVRVDGVVAADLKLRGKPYPDTYLEAARRLGVPPKASVVVEDAASGVEAGKAGAFGLVIGVDRHHDPNLLWQHGADLVVSDLEELVE